MALIYCPQCGQSVSDKATVCPQCGSSLSTNPVINTNVIKCEDCGAEYDVSLSTCPKCGCPNTSKPLAPKKNKHIGLIVSLIVVAALIVVGTVSFLKVYYDNYLKMTKMVINPTGSLNTFSDDFNSIDTETVSSFEKMKLYLD